MATAPDRDDWTTPEEYRAYAEKYLADDTGRIPRSVDEVCKNPLAFARFTVMQKTAALTGQISKLRQLHSEAFGSLPPAKALEAHACAERMMALSTTIEAALREVIRLTPRRKPDHDPETGELF